MPRRDMVCSACKHSYVRQTLAGYLRNGAAGPEVGLQERALRLRLRLRARRRGRRRKCIVGWPQPDSGRGARR
jgi:hypothetical protein